jgi:hypothetical protein
VEHSGAVLLGTDPVDVLIRFNYGMIGIDHDHFIPIELSVLSDPIRV